MPTATPLNDKIAAVTGGGGGIGGSISRLFAEAGAAVVVNDIDAELAAAAVGDITDAGGRATAVVGDITDAAVVAEFHRAAVDFGDGRVDVLVNNVGDYRPGMGRFLKTTEADWDAQIDITLRHVLRCSHAFLPTMIDGGGGTVVNMSTVESMRGITRMAVYSAANAAVSAFTRCLALEMAEHDIRVNCIAPDMAMTLQTPLDAMLRGRPLEHAERWIPLSRFGDPEEFAQVALFLASDQSSFMTGQTIPVDGGTMTAQGWYRRADGRGFTNLPDAP
ncbi:SDR family NAD(P)-dependent oxidoreductase [Candidatus Poriferisocius sp.]|uniref:SDR family NAD(P)-dependent oxidoreductase n=1 Tax=Candidatus Poriferisocius sp. TaxID=3101276 RepID=UPI003B599F06